MLAGRGPLQFMVYILKGGSSLLVSSRSRRLLTLFNIVSNMFEDVVCPESLVACDIDFLSGRLNIYFNQTIRHDQTTLNRSPDGDKTQVCVHHSGGISLGRTARGL